MRINRNAYAIMKKSTWSTPMKVCMYKPAWAVSIISLHLYIPATSNPPTESLMKESTSAADGGNHRERVLGDYFLVYPPAPLSFPSKLKRYCSRSNYSGRNCWDVREYILMFSSSAVLTQLIKNLHFWGHWYLRQIDPPHPPPPPRNSKSGTSLRQLYNSCFKRWHGQAIFTMKWKGIARKIWKPCYTSRKRETFVM